MTTRFRAWVLLPCVSFLVACGSKSDPVAPRLQAMSFANSEWSNPVHLPPPINSAARELGAALSRDELSIYFGSDRAGGLGAFDIWVSHRDCLDCPWGDAVNLGPNINSLMGDGSPALSSDGHLLFFSGSRGGGEGGEDMWVSRRTNTNDDLAWEPAVNLGPNVNTPADEHGSAYVPASEGGGVNLYFSRGGDIYAARVSRDGEVEGAAEPVVELNDPTTIDDNPTMRADGREVYFWSNRLGGLGGSDIWVATRRSPHDPWSAPENVGSVINTRFADLTPTLSHDGRTLLFAAAANARPSLGFQDIWMATRTPGGQ